MASKFTKIIDSSFRGSDMEATAKVGGVTFTFAAHTNRDEFIQIEKLAEAQESPDGAISAMADMRARTIASVLRKINDEPIPELIEMEDGTKVERVLALTEEISAWPASLITVLYGITSDFKKRVRKVIRSSVEYDWFGVNLVEEEEQREEAEALQMQKIAEEQSAKALAPVDESKDMHEAAGQEEG